MESCTKTVSIFNEVIGPVMRGCSSSHVAAALRIGLLARNIANNVPERAIVRFDSNEALSLSYDGQGSSIGFIGGILGFEPDSPLIPEARAHAKNAGIQVSFLVEDIRTSHPNTYLLEIYEHGNEQPFTMEAVSLGGGAIEVRNINGASVSLAGDAYTYLFFSKHNAPITEAISAECGAFDGFLSLEASAYAQGSIVILRTFIAINQDALASLQAKLEATHTRTLEPVMPVLASTESAPFRTASAMIASDPSASLCTLACNYESAHSGKTEQELIAMMQDIARIMRRSIDIGIAGTTYEDRILKAQAPLCASMVNNPLLGPCESKAIQNVAALMDCKSAMEVIVAAPTAGACGTLGGTVWAAAEVLGLDDYAVAKALLSAGMIGVFIAEHASFAGEEGGCQVECGSGSAMAAAAIVDMQGGTAQEAIDAASMALQNMLGLVCDTICDRVEFPCMGRNIMGAVNAITCAGMIRAGFTNVIPLDETILALKQVTGLIPLELRCTGLAGLAQSPTAQCMLKKFGSSSGSNS